MPPNAGLQLNIVNSSGERVSNFNPNLKVQKNLLKLKEMALQN